MTDMTSVFGPFCDDHRRVLSQLDSLERSIAGDAPLGSLAREEAQAVVLLLREQFATHVSAEERVLYPDLLKAFPEGAASIGPLQLEHVEMRAMLARLEELLPQPHAPARDEQIVVQARDLIDLLRLHIRKEEHAVFNVAVRVLTAPELTRLAERIARHRRMPDSETGPGPGKDSVHEA